MKLIEGELQHCSGQGRPLLIRCASTDGSNLRKQNVRRGSIPEVRVAELCTVCCQHLQKQIGTGLWATAADDADAPASASSSRGRGWRSSGSWRQADARADGCQPLRRATHPPRW